MRKLLALCFWTLMPLMAAGGFNSPGTFLGMERDGEMEAIVKEWYAAIGLNARIFVVIHPGAPGCAYASIHSSGQQVMGYDPACRGPLRTGGAYNWRALNILGHECGHLLGAHVLTKAHSHEEELEADFWAGWAMGRLGATLEQAQTVFRTFPEQPSKTHPGRADRLRAVERGWMRSRSDTRPAPSPKMPQFPSQDRRSWWEDLMSRPLPWAR